MAEKRSSHLLSAPSSWVMVEIDVASIERCWYDTVKDDETHYVPAKKLN
jgi:hypothetical protein